MEQIFISEARLSPRLREMGAAHRRHPLQPMVKLCAYCNRRDPEIDAELLLDIITALECQGVGRHLQAVNRQWLPALIHGQLGWLPGLRRA